MVHNDQLIIPYAMSDSIAGIATLCLPELMAQLREIAFMRKRGIDSAGPIINRRVLLVARLCQATQRVSRDEQVIDCSNCGERIRVSK